MAKAVTLKNNNNEEVYPVTDIDLVNGDINGVRIANASVGSDKLTANAVWEENIKDGAVTSAKIDWASAKADPDVGDGLGWVYLGQIKLTAAASSLTFTLPAQYNNYKVIFEGEMNGDAASNTWIDFRMMNGSNYLSGGYQVQDVNGTNWSAGTYTGSYAVNGTASAYDAVNIEWTSYCQIPGINYRKSQGFFYRAGSSYQTRIHNGRLGDASSPTSFQVISGSKFQQNATMKVWGSNT